MRSYETWCKETFLQLPISCHVILKFVFTCQPINHIWVSIHNKSDIWKSFLPSLIQYVSTIQIRRLNMKRVNETTTDDYKRQLPWHSRLGCLGWSWQGDGRQMPNDCVHQFVENICLPFQSTPVFSQVHFKLCNVS